MRSAPLSSAHRGSIIALALATALAAVPLAQPVAQTRDPRIVHPGAIIVQATDTAINPIPAEIVIPAFAFRVKLSEEGGAILLNIPDGVYLLQARRIGHRPDWRLVQVRGDTAAAEFVLAPAGRYYGGLAEFRLRDFLRRSPGMINASFVSRADIERRRPKTVATILARNDDVTVDRSGGPTLVHSRLVPRAGCDGMLVFVDGVAAATQRVTHEPNLRERAAAAVRAARELLGGVTSDAGADAARLSAASTGLSNSMESEASTRTLSVLDWLPVSTLAALEIYPTIDDVPPEFRIGGAECGVVLLWLVTEGDG